MNVPFDIEKYKNKKLDYELKRFSELYSKYKDDMNEILELAELWEKFVPNIQNKYKECMDKYR